MTGAGGRYADRRGGGDGGAHRLSEWRAKIANRPADTREPLYGVTILSGSTLYSGNTNATSRGPPPTVSAMYCRPSTR